MTTNHRNQPPSTQRAATSGAGEAHRSTRAAASRERDAGRAAHDQPARPLTAAQLAAPSTRRWRRAGRFAPTTR